MNVSMNKLNPKALGLAAAVVTSLWWFLTMTFSLLTGIGEMTMITLGSYHPFFSYSWPGMVVVVVESFIYNFVVGYVFVLLYNKFLK